mmetsp:Transcript_19490/g.22302  ORF Transcript_19490/g.22302 Transcript_19490/m.22302 type:complete len:777 (-) Transcript_19490:631-2961(-)|eukprot:CAMPEP_0194182154 /NCGR_PEP_ID=MMETSP0154-20130528/22179_1 /TAXON_ID=1049557 /ORGANISM="Thalassiothrix antarctica, Strain L6-D1" /LENGTH=776 /DNA_ID=CAMNT_0038898309 /DNA_START=48 /DNA_END=2378 /DNA_ORIENTATION=-
MEDSDFLCPLCCEELDISDRNFYPCKCGYQVCMWCWHRIRESESGLCPACRTPYGDDPHEFSAVDVQEVLKANKEKAAAEKKHATSKDDVDRTALANMRVIRRNLVYAVGLPPLSEDNLRKPEYFGQYGKISKIVLNRNNPPAGDVRRASASAYVTFLHKEDTLSCILALDGFYMDGRNIRASYGTSKYCSAFIKSVRCNNPECTYLHSMGEKDDTFTKQEIQAGYVTSGRDVLERQQMPGARRKVGGGGPSGTGKGSITPVFPPPTYEEAARPPALVVQTSTGSTGLRSTSAGAVMSKIRSSSLSTSPPTNIASAGRVLSAASVVAGMHAPEPLVPPAPRTTTLTPLTPLKPRSTSISSKTKLLQQQQHHQQQQQNQQQQDEGVVQKTIQGLSPDNAIGIVSISKNDDLIGGAVIGGSMLIGPSNNIGIQSEGSSLLGGNITSRPLATTSFLTSLGGEIYTGPIGRDEWSAPGNNNGLQHSNNNNSMNMGLSAVGSGVIIGGKSGYGAIGGCTIGFNNSSLTNGSSALASMLGINLPTGSGSLANDGNLLWQQQRQQQQQLHIHLPQGSGAIGSPTSSVGPIGPSGLRSNSSGSLGGGSLGGGPMIGGSNSVMRTIGSGTININRGSMAGAQSAIVVPGLKSNTAIGGMANPQGGARPSERGVGGVGVDGKHSDIALLQSLLPGVHITSGHGQQQATGDVNHFGSVGSNWNNGREMEKTWSNGLQAAPNAAVISASKQQLHHHHQPHPQQHPQHQVQRETHHQQHQQQQNQNNIW